MKFATAAVWLLIMAGPLLGQSSKSYSGTDFVSDFRSIVGEKILIKDCFIAGTTSSFIRCETPNGSVSYALEADTMDKADYRYALENCPTGSRRKTGCKFSVSGAVRQSSMPRLDNAKFGPYGQSTPH